MAGTRQDCRFVIVGFALVAAIGFTGQPAIAIVGPTPVGPGYQCPSDIDIDPQNGYAVGAAMDPADHDGNGNGVWDPNPNVVCMRLGVTDGYAKMPVTDPAAPAEEQYLFGFVDLTHVPENEIIDYKFRAHLPAPTIEVKEGQTLYLTETTLALFVRPDLFDSHTLHFHGYPHAMAIFDGVPEASIAVPAGRDFTYFYKLNDPGTYPYHCHFEPVEHIELGMIGTIIVRPAQDGGADSLPGSYAYNDGGLAPNTQYDVAYNLLVDEMDSTMHWNLENIQEGANLWHTYHPNYFTLNGRAYPETVLADTDPAMTNQNGYIAQTSSLITAAPGQRVLLRLTNLGFQTHTLTIPGLSMQVVGEDAKLLRGPSGKDLSYRKTTYSIAGGKTADLILDTTGLTSGRSYFLFGRELNSQHNLSRFERLAGQGGERRGGMMTEIRIQ